ncbi:DNA damage-induced apoptosis suppressor protein [Python bivittatus]|uniref:DNA damage-induced apoptosis suppressor protein n=1 Tax=Python bivittatus TaxID=176946 RepID=A0A9F2WKF8_PYTBI|nr:DNA damage-induced apoptosis suppressor protein [Python bivittatus]XP_007443908.1 DNA damage-induced apoptosis suppressor protein [Python bivittatus]XP_025032452.1 DNA damage-induced apoptosis suppressor protein [Python bivittatus]XP_025032453.1 DNA damage-induced apoptosis suppressor protein [Python bivittatus]XP_025032454.1 DNA damage-induced apoptosis suppressor protein [Python bivittatus]
MNGRRFLVASVISIQNCSFVYPSCPSCFSKLSLQFRRYNCQKCGCSGDTKEANYRYRLLLEVADTRDIFEVTVFGSCLDTYFGVTAKGLQRYIEELNREAGEAENDTVLGVLFHAVETCFVGKKFVFRIKGCDKPNVVSLLQKGCQIDRNTKSLIACEMFVPPHPGLVGYTVIHYIEQQRCFRFKYSPRGLWPPDHVMAFDHPSRELKNLHVSNGLDVVQSGHINFSSFWPCSFGLTWSSTSSETTEHSVALVSCETTSDKQKCKDGSITSRSQLVYNLKDRNLTLNKGYVHEDKKPHLYSFPQSTTTKNELGRRSSIKRKDGNVLESPLALEQKDSSGKIDIQSSYGLGNPWNPLPHKRHKGHLASSSSPYATVDAASQEVSSESLNEFLARLENNSATTDLQNIQEQHSSSGVCEKSGEDKENELLPEEQDYSFRGNDVCCFPLVGSNCPKASFDASADLFDISARGSTKATLAMLHLPQIVSPGAGELTPNCIASEFMPNKVNASWNSSHYGLSFHDALDVSAPKTSTPVAGSVFKSECSLVGTLDFMPDSHSIPLARPCHQGSLSAGKEAILSELPLNKLPWDNAKCKRSRLPFKNSLVKQLVSKFPPSARSSNADAGTVNPCGPQQLFMNRILAKELLPEDDGKGWVPSSEKFQVQDENVWRRKRRESRVRHNSDRQVTENSPLSESQGRSLIPRNLSRLAKVGSLPKRQQPAEANVGGQPIYQQRTMLGQLLTESPALPPFVGISKSSLLPTQSPVPNIADCSSELFSGYEQLPSMEATTSKPSS